jgi:TonB family protein
MSKIFFLCFLSASIAAGQSSNTHHEAAYPALGWDSLRYQIAYPELARRTGVEGVVSVAVKIDSVGNVIDVIVSGNSIFSSTIEAAVKNVVWQPDIANYKIRSSTVFFDVRFQYRDPKASKKKVLLIETDKPQ